MMRPKRFSILFSMFFCLALILGGCGSGGGSGDGDGGGTNTSGNSGDLQFITSFGQDGVDIGYYDDMDVTDNGEVFIHNSTVDTDTKINTTHIYKFNSDHSYAGQLMNYRTYVGYKSNFVIDGLDRMHVYSMLSGSMYHDVYALNDFSETLENYSSPDNVHIGADIDMDSSGNHYMLGNGSSGVDGKYLFVWKVNYDFTEEPLDKLEKIELLPMLPPGTVEDDVTLNSIRVAPNGNLLICVDLNGVDNNDDDGILVLDSNLDKLAYIGGNWLFNFPVGVDFDDSNNFYVTSTYGNHITVFNFDGEKIAYVEGTDISGIANNEDFKPGAIRVKNGKVYVANWEDSRIYVFRTIN